MDSTAKRPSPAVSISSSSSLPSQQDANFKLPPAQSGPFANGAAEGNGTPSQPSEAKRPQTTQRKPTMTSRLGSVFGRGEHSQHAAKEKAEKAAAAAASNQDSSANNSDANRSPSIKPRLPMRMASQTEKRNGSVSGSSSHAERSKSVSASGDKKKDSANANPNCVARSRFWVNEDGTHEHQLKSMKRQEKLSHMLREFMMGKKKEGHEEQPLSLMANWVDQVRSDKDKIASVEKGGPNSSLTLVQKYGKCQEIIGRGAFGIVRVSHKPDANDPKREKLYAVKEFRQRPTESDRKYQKRLTAEFCISSAMHHPNVIQTLDLLKDDKGDFCEVMEFCAGGDLYTLVLAATQLDVTEADCYFKQLMRGVEYLHEMGVAHRDLKPENLLLTSRGSIKITDFGNGECFRMAWEKEAHMTAGLCGSGPYIAPEEYVDEEFDPRAVDIWACGVIYMAMRTGRHLWRVAQKEEDEFYTRYLQDRRQEEGYRPIEVLRRQKCRNVIYSILDPNPTRRLTAHQVLLSEWVKDIKVCEAGNEGY